MIQTVEIFYSFECPYSYLAIDKLSQIENQFDVKVLWQPFSAKASGKSFQTNHSSTAMPAERASYIREDAVRLATAMEMPIVMRPDWPDSDFDPEKSIRGALVASDLDSILEYNIKLFQRWWGEGLDPNDQSFFIELCDNLDVDANEFSGRINSADTRERVRGVFKRGKKLQIFDTPTIVIGEERLVGVERLPMVEEQLTALGVKKARWT